MFQHSRLQALGNVATAILKHGFPDDVVDDSTLHSTSMDVDNLAMDNGEEVTRMPIDHLQQSVLATNAAHSALELRILPKTTASDNNHALQQY